LIPTPSTNKKYISIKASDGTGNSGPKNAMPHQQKRYRILRIFFATAIVAIASLPVDTLAFLRAMPKSTSSADDTTNQNPASQVEHQARRTINENNFYDPKNPDDYRLQRVEEATSHLPYDAVGFPDWMRALREGLIQPRSSLSGKGEMEILNLDIIMKNTKEMPYVRFPHSSHTMWLACSNCHPDPFIPIAGSTSIRMADIFRGQYCGKCHDRVAFVTFFSCTRCHSVPKP
jgi:c(7)-type cytochrome triheme protein